METRSKSLLLVSIHSSILVSPFILINPGLTVVIIISACWYIVVSTFKMQSIIKAVFPFQDSWNFRNFTKIQIIRKPACYISKAWIWYNEINMATLLLYEAWVTLYKSGTIFIKFSQNYPCSDYVAAISVWLHLYSINHIISGCSVWRRSQWFLKILKMFH